jgi:DNA-binding NtrC family response regulator
MPNKMVVYLVRDLLFTSKIKASADALGVPMKGVRTVADLAAAAKDAQLAIIDLRLPEAFDAIAAVRAAAPDLPTVGFLDHEQVDRMQEAEQRGFTRVLAKGKFSTELPKMLGEITGSRT